MECHEMQLFTYISFNDFIPKRRSPSLMTI
jgi:hypothetical protein